MTAPPLPTFVPQDAWYRLTLGSINPSIADTVPDISYLLPSVDDTGADIDGLVGGLDQGIVYLAGTSTQLDGGQKLLMWDADSLLPSDGVRVFCPFVDTSTPGRWLSTTVPRQNYSLQEFEAGASYEVDGSAILFNIVLVKGRVANAQTTLVLPSNPTIGQTFQVKDAEGDAGTYNIVISAIGIDGDATNTLVADYQARSYMWNGSEYSIV